MVICWLTAVALCFAQPAPAGAAKATKEHEQAVTLATAVVEDLSKSEFDTVVAGFDTTMKSGLPAATLKQVWEGTLSQFGEFKKSGGVRADKVDKYVVVLVTMEFARGKLDAKVVYDAEHKVAGFFFVPNGKYEQPSYAKPDSFTEVEISVGKGLLPLPGTLTLPKGDGPFPAMVLVHGSGPNDRDETIGPNKPFCDLAHGLASRGIAVLRYEKRTKQYATLMALTSGALTVQEETVNDAAAAVDTLLGQDKIDRARIFVLGHSLSGYVIPRIAKATDKPAGFISLAGSTRPMEDLILEQTEYILSLDGKLSEAEEKELAKIKAQVARVKSKELTPSTSASDLPLGIPAKYWLDLRDYNPAESAKDIKKPLLFLQGERDYQVTLEDFAGWRAAVGSREDVKLIAYPKLDHLFREGTGKSAPVEYFAPGSVAEEVVRDIVSWVNSPTGK